MEWPGTRDILLNFIAPLVLGAFFSWFSTKVKRVYDERDAERREHQSMEHRIEELERQLREARVRSGHGGVGKD